MHYSKRLSSPSAVSTPILSVLTVTAALAIALLAAPLSAKPRLQTGPDAEITYDGLYRVDKSVVDAAWVKPDLDLSGYTKLMLVDSMSNEVLARAADRRAAESEGWPIDANTVTVWPEVRQLAQTWARLLRKRLDSFESVGELSN